MVRPRPGHTPGRGWSGCAGGRSAAIGSSSCPRRSTRAPSGLDIDPDRAFVLPDGFDPRTFVRRDVDRAALLREALVDAPRGWLAGQRAGSMRYDAEDLAPLVDGVVVLTVSRFTGVKRLPLLIEAFAQARDRARTPASLVILGGHPGEWEGEHPADTIARLGVRGVFLAGWQITTRCRRSCRSPTCSPWPPCASSSAWCSSKR